jgi:hypothetical protein
LRISALPQNWHFTPGWLTGLLAMSPILDHFYWTTPLIAAVHESRTLAALQDALLPKLISGEIRVKDAERFLKERGL